MCDGSDPSSTTISREPIRYLINPLQRFLLIEAADGAILLVAAVFALGVAISPLGDAYLAFWQKSVGLHLDIHALMLSLVGIGLFIGRLKIGVLSNLVFLLVGTWIWFELHVSGIHATVAGVILAGIGFTMALFIAGLALDGELLNHAKIGVMMGSLLSAIAGMAILLLLGRRPPSG